jgi:hypothetical protein
MWAFSAEKPVDVSASSSTPFSFYHNNTTIPSKFGQKKKDYPKRLTRGDDAKQAQINQGLPCMLITGGCWCT